MRQMTISSFLTDDQITIILDTSVVINLSACTFGSRILRALPNKIVIAGIASSELKHGTEERDFFEEILNEGIVTTSELTSQEYGIFADLTSKSPTIHDGEAATIAIAHRRNWFPVIDDERGRSRAISLMALPEPGWSVEVFRHPSVISELGQPVDVEALFLALREGRMRIPISRREEVILLIGEDRARDCTCLPGYKERFPRP